MSFALAFAVLFASLSGAEPAPASLSITKDVSQPPLNQEATAAIGEDMLKQGRVTAVNGVQIQGEVVIKDLMGNRYIVSPGFYPTTDDNKKYSIHSFQPNSSNRSGFGAITGPGSERISSIKINRITRQVCYGYQGTRCAPGPAKFEYVTRPVETENSFQQTLIYNGKNGNHIRLGYRESYANNARPAFANEVEYDLNESRDIRYRGARLKIISADNSEIRYVVLSNFTPPM